MKNKFLKVIKDAAAALKGEESKKKYITAFCAFLILSLFMEVFLFNFRTFESLFFNKADNITYTVSNASKLSDGRYRSDNETVEIAADDINIDLKNVYIGLERDSAVYTKVRLWAKDEANFNGISTPEREIVSGLTQTKYIKTNFGGKTEDLRISLSGFTSGEEFTLNDVKLNAHVPLCFSVLRFLFVLGVMMLLFVIRPKSFMYKHKLDLKIKWQKYVVIGFLIVQAILILGLCFVEPRYIHSDGMGSAPLQYQELADSFCKGQAYLEKDPTKELMELDNPYDPGERQSNGAGYEWDHAYYNGHYYVYFGVVPVILFYLPYRIITGGNLNNIAVVFICCFLVSAAVLALLYAVAKKWFKKTTFGVFMLMSIMMCDTCGIMYMAKRPNIYSIPIAAALMFVLFGLSLWISAETVDENGNIKLRTGHIAAGSACMALVAGCRPHFLFASVFVIIIFWNNVFKDRLLFSKKSIKNTAAICLPFLIVGIGLMYYNYIRFGSPFDFGANYNLTTNDMTHRGIMMDRNITGLFYYLFQPFSISNIFPFVNTTGVQTLYQGKTIAEAMHGGLLFMVPVTLLGIRGIWKKKWYHSSGDMRPYVIGICAVILCIITVITDVQASGILPRYYGDFSWLLLLSASIAVFAEYGNIEQKQALIKVILTCFIISGIVFGLNIFYDADVSVAEANPSLFFKAKYLIGFLL